MGQYAVLSYQPKDRYRGVAVVFAMKACESGIWVQLAHVSGAAKIWVGAAYFQTGVAKDEHTSQVLCHMECLPQVGQTELVVLGADANSGIGWTETEADKIAAGHSGKTLAMLSRMMAVGLQPIPQADVQAPTFWTRKTPATSSQIDLICTNKLGKCSEVEVLQGSRQILGTDHEQLCVRVHAVAAKSRRRTRKGGIRVVVPDARIGPQHVTDLTQEKLEGLAREFTQPMPAMAFKVPAEIRNLKTIARRSRAPLDWILYCKKLRDARVQWRQSKFEEAAGDWAAYRWATKTKTRWEDDFAAAQNGFPGKCIRDHFEGVFASKPPGEIDARIAKLQSRLPGAPGVAFHVGEVRKAVFQGAGRKSIGPDGVPQELLKMICGLEEGAGVG